MIPVSFFNYYWLNQFIYLFLSILFIYSFSFNYSFLNFSYLLSCDLLSYSLILLRLWICSLIIIARRRIYLRNTYHQLFLFLVLILIISLYFTFSSTNLFIFYLFFEISLIPTLFLIIGWGSQPERIQAGIYLIFYTLFASLPIIVALFFVYSNDLTLRFFLFRTYDSFYLFFCITFVFLIKSPIFLVHLWLPKAHVEAPISGSIILAGVILKLGGYGIIRLFFLFSRIIKIYGYIFISISLIGGVLISLICLRQTDIKSLIAYSSVSHIGLVIRGLITLNYWGFAGSFFIIIAHGLCSSGLFCLANISYERLGRRSLYLNKGLINIIPSLSIWWFLFRACNIAAPPSLNLLGEIRLINSLVSWRSLTIYILIFISFFRAVYSLYLYSFTQHGKIFMGVYSFYSSSVREFLLLFLHWFPLNILVVKGEFFSLWNYLSSLIKNFGLWFQRCNYLPWIIICIYYSFFFLIISIRIFIFSLFFISIDLRIMLEFSFFSFNSCSIIITLLFDWKSLLFSRFVFFISSIVVFYRDEYIHGDLNLNRFIILVSLFVCSIILLIFRPNLIRILLGWDGLGLVSYCLVIYYQNIKSYNAGILTALSNRIGDVALLISIAWIINFGRWNYIYWLDCIKQDFHIIIISYLIVLAAITKSAQIPFSSWLPAAIAAPTPVSSLVHSSTLVTAGVYLLIRFRPCFSQNLYLFLLLISRLTMFIAGLGANFEFDLKKIIALSTLRQLGLIIGILAIGERNLAFFHLLTHALFKALLFICAGNIIHNLLNCQDIRFMGRLVIHIPLTCTFFNICNIALCGIPFLAGFYSKDLILEVLSINYIGIFIYLIFFVSTGLTVSYSIRLAYYTIIGDNNFLVYSSLRERRFTILKGIIGLIFFVIIGGSILIWLILSTPYFICLPFVIKIIALIVTFCGVWFGYELSIFSYNKKLLSISYLKITLFSSLIWNLPFISTFGVNYYPVYIGGQIYQKLDNGWLEYFGGKNFFQNIKNISRVLNFLYNNNLKINLILFIFLLIIIFIIYSNSL